MLHGIGLMGRQGRAVSGGPAIDLSFMTPGTLDPRLTFTRASTGTYFDVAGTMQTASNDQPRWEYDAITHVLKGLLIEDVRTNLFLNSATLTTQSVTVAAAMYTLSFYGTGTVTLSGVSTAGPLTGTGAYPQRVSLQFTPTAGTLTCTVTGSVVNAQIEQGRQATSYIPTAGATVTRAVDRCFFSSANMGWFKPPGGTWFAEFMTFTPLPAVGERIFGRPTAGGEGVMNHNASHFLTSFDSIAVVATTNVITPNVVTKGATTWAVGTAKICVNGGAVGTSAALTNGFAILTSTGGYFFTGNTGTPAECTNGCMRAFRYWTSILSNADMQAVTT